MRSVTNGTKLLTVLEVSERLALKPATIRKMMYLRQIPVVRPTKRAVRIREEDVEAIIAGGLTPARKDGLK